MKPLLRPVISTVLFCCAILAPAQNTIRPEVVQAASMLAFGRQASTAELANPNFANKSVADLVQLHRAALKADAAIQQRVDDQARLDAFGANTGAAKSSAEGVLYVERLKQHVDYLAAHPDEYRQVIERAYQLVIHRAAYAEEFEYWKPRGTLPFVLLLGSIENWAFRNQPGLMVTTGTPSIAVASRFLSTVSLPPAVANEARAILGLPIWTDVARLKNPGCNVIAVSAGDIASVGGVPFILAGGGPLGPR
jgi:hypothetical protein